MPSRPVRSAVAALGLLLSLAACGDSSRPAGPIRLGQPGADAAVTDPRPDAGPPAPPAEDLPCEIAETIAAHCTVCHGDPLTGGARMRLLSHTDLTDPSYADPAATFAQRAVIRMRSPTMPMPPAGPRVPEERIAAFEAWVAAGAPSGTCGVVDPFDTPVQCSSGETWPADAEEGPRMHPGGACITCHAMQADGPNLWLGGTVYPTAHEPIDCLGADTGGAAVVEITDAAGRVFMLTPNESGNFLLENEDSADSGYVAPFSPVFEYPYRARVLFEGRERAMATPQTTGDCNSCHTVEGANGAPGRIVLP